MSRSTADLEIEFEDTVGIGSVRRVKNLVSLTGKFREDDEERRIMNEKAINFVKQKDQERRERVKIRKSRIFKQKQKFEKIDKGREEKKKQNEENKHKEIMERYEESLRKNEEHAKQREEFAKPIKLDREYMHKKLENRYKQEVEIPTLQQKKLELEKIRNFYKPIQRKDIDDHDKNFVETLKLKEKELKLKREIEARELGVGVSFD